MPTPQPAPSGGRHLLLPDISFTGQSAGELSTDRRDEARNRVRFTEGEIAIQSYVYPKVKADAFITMSPQEDEPAQVEEAYLSYLGIRPRVNLYVGKKKAAFGRTNQLHSHSWLYVHQPLALRNLVGDESIVGEGIGLSYLLPTTGNWFSQLDIGTWTSGEGGASTSLPEIERGPGAGFGGTYNTARLWNSYSPNPDTEIELGGSYAEGASTDTSIPTSGRVKLTGVDLTYRHYGENDKRVLLRGENFWRGEAYDSGTASTATGYYLFGNYRWDRYHSFGLLYDWSEFPQATNLHESALSAIYTRQFSEQYYVRLQATHGSRPGANSYNELWLQWVWGVGPHTHNLE